MFRVILLYADGTTATLSVKNTLSWKTKRCAIKHATDISKVKSEEGALKGCLQIWVEDECGDIIRSFPVSR